MLKSLALRRVLIYVALSSAGVAVVRPVDLDQRSAGVIYVPMFIGIYVLSRWIEAKVSGSAVTTTTPEKAPSKGFLEKS